jgi:hypothetical protein
MNYAQAQAQAQAQPQADALAQVQAKADAVQRNFKRLKLPYEQSLIKRPRLADLLMSRHLAVEQAIGLGLWEDAELALAAFETALRTPPSGEDALLGLSKAPKQVATGTPLSVEPTLLGAEEQRAADLKDRAAAKPTPPRPRQPAPPDPRLQKQLQERAGITADAANRAKAIVDGLPRFYGKADRDKLLLDCETDSESDFGRILGVLDHNAKDGYEKRLSRYIEAKQKALQYIKDHGEPKVGKLPTRVLKRKQACAKIVADIDKQLVNIGEQNLVATELGKSYQAKVAQGTSVSFDACTQLETLLELRLLSDDTKRELQAAIDAIRQQERTAGYDAIKKLPPNAGDRDKAELLNRHGCFKGTGGGTSDVRLLQNEDKSIAFAFKSVSGESQGGLDFLGLDKGASAMREDITSLICSEVGSSANGTLDLGFPTSRVVQLDGKSGALIEGVKGEMADPEELNGLTDYERKFGAEAAAKKRAEIKKACQEIPDKVSADSLQNVVLSSVLTCQWDCKWGNMIVEGGRARPIDGGTAIPTKGVMKTFMEDKGGPPSVEGYILYPAYHDKAGEVMPTAKQPMPPEKVAAILALKPTAVAAKAKARRDQLLQEFPDFDMSLMEDSCIDIVQASMEGAQNILKTDPTISLEGFVKAYEGWFVDYYNKNIKA